MFIVPVRSSDAVDFMSVDPIFGDVNVCFNDGNAYTYHNVSRRAIINLMLNPNMSLGFWVNDNCVNSKRATVAHRYSVAV